MAERVQVRFRGSKDDQLRQGAILTRARDSPPNAVNVREGACRRSNVLTNVMLSVPLPSTPLVAFGCGSGR